MKPHQFDFDGMNDDCRIHALSLCYVRQSILKNDSNKGVILYAVRHKILCFAIAIYFSTGYFNFKF